MSYTHHHVSFATQRYRELWIKGSSAIVMLFDFDACCFFFNGPAPHSLGRCKSVLLNGNLHCHCNRRLRSQFVRIAQFSKLCIHERETGTMVTTLPASLEPFVLDDGCYHNTTTYTTGCERITTSSASKSGAPLHPSPTGIGDRKIQAKLLRG